MDSLFLVFKELFIVSNITASETPSVLAASFENFRKLSVISLLWITEVRLSEVY